MIEQLTAEVTRLTSEDAIESVVVETHNALSSALNIIGRVAPVLEAPKAKAKAKRAPAKRAAKKAA